ncbi:hypothetical protein [Lutimaribacter saemankumensis]|uniref:Glucosyl transferase GtrII n=1 Tax=Lutimaribacter saemankumensis TaxID=490829 RepID=A0A1G8REH5_9RHOB|nr:hypothetical protein [Lutimaribacter saemankumensis]SDJ14760.1 hypothetical protein SAMN05421850_10965 [Lutimaribacter saemankumensis]
MVPQLKVFSSYMVTFVVIACAFWMASFGFFFDFFRVEDANVLFNRSNYTDLPPFFYYQGYASIPAQLVAHIVAGTLPVFQSFIYIFSALVIFCYMSVLLLRATGFSPFALLSIGVVFLFGRTFVYNLTYSLWPSAMVLSLFGYLALREDRGLKSNEATIACFLSLASPLSLFSAIPIYVVALKSRTVPSILAALASVLAYPILIEHGGRGGAEQLISTLSSNFQIISQSPSLIFPVLLDGFAVERSFWAILFGATQSFALISTILIPLLYIAGFRCKPIEDLVPFAVGCLCIFVLAIASRNLGDRPPAFRYYFPSVIFFGAVLAQVKINFPQSILRLCGSVVLVFWTFETTSMMADRGLDNFFALTEFKYNKSKLFGEGTAFFTINNYNRPRSQFYIALGNGTFSGDYCTQYGRGLEFDFQIFCSGSNVILFSLDGGIVNVLRP